MVLSVRLRLTAASISSLLEKVNREFKRGCDVKFCKQAAQAAFVRVAEGFSPAGEPVARKHTPHPLSAAFTILAVPNTTGAMSRPQRILLPYDGSPKSEEALFFATYLALHWKQQLAVLTVGEGERTTDATLERARGYVETHGIEASYLIEHGAASDAIVRAAGRC